MEHTAAAEDHEGLGKFSAFLEEKSKFYAIRNFFTRFY